MRTKNMRLLAKIWLASILNICQANDLDGPGMTVTYYGTMKNVHINIKSAHLPSGKEFPTAGSFGYAKNGLEGGKTMGAAPDGRQLPEWIDFAWVESPSPELKQRPDQSYQDWVTELMAAFHTLPVKTQRITVRNLIPKSVIAEAINANAHVIARYGTEKRLSICFIWTSEGIKLHWKIWHTPKFDLQYYSHEGGDEVVPEGTTMVAVYANTIKDVNTVVHPGNRVTRTPPLGQSDFSGSWAFAYTDRPLDGGGLVVAIEHEPMLPETINFDWRLFPLSTPRASGETDTEYQSRVHDIYHALPKKNESVEVRNRIPQDVQDELLAATRKLATDKISNSVIYLYFIWTENGIKLHWRLWRQTEAGGGSFSREGGDDIATPQ